ncbi:MAG TPA: PaaI family thioesterase [Usitatibacter sp.]|nr:PaaI family thioesterase [Usitatibacter sp.]
MRDIGQAVGRAIPFASLLGIQLRERSAGHVVLELPLREELMNSAGTAHGGVLMTLLDVAMSVAARTAAPDVYFAVTMEMKTTFIATCSGLLVAEARCIHAARSVAFSEGEVREDASGRLVARASGTFMLRRERAGGESASQPSQDS